MTKQTLIVEMDEGLAALLQEAGELKIIEEVVPADRLKMATDRISPEHRAAAADWMGGKVTNRREEPDPPKPAPKKTGGDFASKFRKKS